MCYVSVPEETLLEATSDSDMQIHRCLTAGHATSFFREKGQLISELQAQHDILLVFSSILAI